MSVTLSLFAGAGAQFFDNNGNPLTGGKIYTYAAGTTTPRVTYTTNSDSSLHTNPIVLDSAGRVPSGGEIWLQLGVGYKFVVKTSADVLIATYDNIPSAAQPPAANDADSIMYEQGYTVTAGSFVAGKIYRIATIGTTDFTLIGATSNTVGLHFVATGSGSGTGTAELSQTVETKLQQIVSVKDFGAVGDGVADDTAAIQAAINYIKSISGGEVDFPQGNYKITAPINIIGNFGFRGIELRGRRATITSTHNEKAFFALPAGLSSGDAAPEYRQNTLIHGFVIQGPGKSNVASVGVQIQQGANVQVRDCTIQGFYRGLHGYGALICNFHNLLIQDNEFGVDMLPTVPTGAPYDPQFSPNDLHFYDLQIIDNIYAVRATSFPAGAMTFHGCEIEGNNLAGNTADGVRVIEFFNAGKVTFVGCHLEENPGEYNLFFHGNNAACHLNLIGCEIIPGDDCGNCVYLSNASGPANAANAFIAGTRITNNVGNQLYISTGFKVTIIGFIFGGIQGDVEKLNIFRDGHLSSGAVDSAFAQIKAVGDAAFNIAFDYKGILRIVDGAGNRLGYLANGGTSTALLSDAGGLQLGENIGSRVWVARFGTPTFEPNADNTYSLGTAALRWNTVFAGNGTINTSDGTSKQQVRELSDAERAVAVRCKTLIRAFKFNDAVEQKGDGARIHFGVIAQDVKAAFEAEGLDAHKYGLFCYDEWQDQFEDVLDERNVPTGEKSLKIAAGGRYGIRYEQLLAFIIAAI